MYVFLKVIHPYPADQFIFVAFDAQLYCLSPSVLHNDRSVCLGFKVWLQAIYVTHSVGVCLLWKLCYILT